jgi:putative SOS response-associated peptidase YedK
VRILLERLVHGYYEWKAGAGRSKQPYYVRPQDDSPMVFAGLYEWWRDPSKADGDPERWLLSASILTMDSPPEGYAGGRLAELTALHDRVPLPMDRSTMQAWLDPHAADPAALVGLVRAGAHDVAQGWTIDAVGTAVGNVRNDSAGLIQPVGSLFHG